jgi:hypothetical protein
MDLNQATATFPHAVRQAATSAIPVHSPHHNCLTFPLSLVYLWRLKNYTVAGTNKLAFLRPTVYTAFSLRSFQHTSLAFEATNGLHFWPPYSRKPRNSGRLLAILLKLCRLFPPSYVREAKSISPHAKLKFWPNSSSTPIISLSIWVLYATRF